MSNPRDREHWLRSINLLMRIDETHHTEGSDNTLFYLTFSNIKEFLSLYSPTLNIELKIL